MNGLQIDEAGDNFCSCDINAFPCFFVGKVIRFISIPLVLIIATMLSPIFSEEVVIEYKNNQVAITNDLLASSEKLSGLKHDKADVQSGIICKNVDTNNFREENKGSIEVYTIHC